MNCPSCRSKLVQHTTKKGVHFLVCEDWPECRVSGTPALMNRFHWLEGQIDQLRTRLKESREQVAILVDRVRETKDDADQSLPTRLGDIVGRLSELRILQSKMKSATTYPERSVIRKQAEREPQERIRGVAGAASLRDETADG